MSIEMILIVAAPALGFLLLVIVLDRWGRRHDPMGGRRGEIWHMITNSRPGRDDRE